MLAGLLRDPIRRPPRVGRPRDLTAAVLCAAVLMLLAEPSAGTVREPSRTAGDPGAIAAARNAKVVGKVKGIRRWQDRFTASVRAVRGDTTAVVGTRALERARYRLAVPPGVHSLIADVADRLKGRRYEGRSGFRRFKPGARKRADVRVRRAERARRSGEARGEASPTRASPAGPVVGVSPDLKIDGSSIDGALITELVGRPCAGGSEVTVVEIRHRKEIIAEIKRSWSKYFDPSTNIRAGLIKPQTMIGGAGTISGGEATIVVTLTEPGTGRILGTESVTGPVAPPDGLSSLIEQLAKKIADQLCRKYPIYFKVLGASFTETTSAKKTSGTGLCDPFGGFSGSQKFSGSLGAAQFSREFKLDKEFGMLAGQVFPKVPARWTSHQVKGCKIDFGEPAVVPCTYTYPDKSPVPDGLWTTGFSIRAVPGDPSMVRLTWTVSNPSVGAFDAANDQCYVYIFGNLDLSDIEETVPLARFTGTGPQTLTFKGQRTLSFSDFGPVTITHSWNVTLTIQGVDASGKPL